MKLLLVQSDHRIADELASDLTEQHYLVDVASDGQAGWELVEAFAYDLLVLDVMLPKLSGIRLCQQLRNCGKSMPILLLTARSSSEDKVMGLDAGADDYVVKPFNLQELGARIRALLRRVSAHKSPILKYDKLSLDPAACEVTYSGQPLYPTPKEYCLLELFLRNRGRLFNRSVILDQLWNEEPPEEDTVKAHIKGVRHKLKLVGAPADLIETVYGLGYRLNPKY